MYCQGLGLAARWSAVGGCGRWASSFWKCSIGNRLVSRHVSPCLPSRQCAIQDGIASFSVAIPSCQEPIGRARLGVLATDRWSEEVRTFVSQLAKRSVPPGVVEQSFVHTQIWPFLNGPTRALLRSQHGPLASAPFNGAQPFHLLFCLPLTLRTLPMWPPT